MRNNHNYNGKINLILGNMFSGKTSELIRRYKRYSIAGKKCIMIKYKKDIRYDEKMIVTHDDIKIDALICQYLFELDKFVYDYEIICIDEIQFYKDAHIFCDKWANDNLILEICGLNGTFNRTSFDIISKLIPLVDDITFLTSICKETGKEAIYSKLNISYDGDETELIGGDDKYTAVDRKTYFNNSLLIIQHEKNKLKEFIELYLNIHKISLSNIKINHSIEEFLEKNIIFLKKKNKTYEEIASLFINNICN